MTPKAKAALAACIVQVFSYTRDRNGNSRRVYVLVSAVERETLLVTDGDASDDYVLLPHARAIFGDPSIDRSDVVPLLLPPISITRDAWLAFHKHPKFVP